MKLYALGFLSCLLLIAGAIGWAIDGLARRGVA